MNQLNIFELYKSINDKKEAKRSAFENVLVRVHSKIKLAASMDCYQCFYEVPEFIIGVPLFSLTDCITYVIKALKENGFKVNYFYPKTLYINWDPKVINKQDNTRQPRLDASSTNFDSYLLTNKKINGRFKLNTF